MYNLIRHIISLLFIASFSLPVCLSSSVFRGLSETNGLSDLTVCALYKDSVGYVWMGTSTSVECFDGFRFKHYPILGEHRWVNAITETQGNQIWVGSRAGLWRINKESDKLELFAPDIIKCGVNALLSDSDGVLYIGSEKGLFIYKDGQIERVTINPDILSSDNMIVGLNKGEKDMLWILTSSKLYSMNLSTRKIVLCPHDINNQDYTYRRIARVDTKLYLGTMEHGVVVFDILTGKFKDDWIDLGCNVISSLSSDGKDVLYVGTDGNGVHFVSVKDSKIICSFRYEPETSGGIRSNSVYSLLVDREGLIWIGFYQLGLDYTLYQSGLFSTYCYPPYFNSKGMPVRAIAINEHERLIGSRNGLFYVDEKNQRFKSFKSEQLRSSMIMCIYPFQGKYYVGTYGGGMYVLDPSTLSVSDFEPSERLPFVMGHVFCIKSDNEGYLWIATSMGLYRYKDGKCLNHYTNLNSKLPEGNVFEIFFDSTGKGWICTATGLCIWDPSTNSLKSDVFPEGFIHKEKIRAIYEDSGHELYFLPNKGSVFISDLSMNHFRRLQAGTPLDGKDAMSIIEDHEGWLWISTNQGLYRYDKENTFVPYNFVDGLPSSIFLSCFPAIDPFGILWFGNSEGLIYLTGDLRDKRSNSYPLVITDVYVNGKVPFHPNIQKKEDNYKVFLDSSHKNLTICFSDFSYSDPVYMSYEYRMEGIDNGWQLLSGKSELAYYDLSAGKYKFKLRRIGEPDSEIYLSVDIASSFNAALWGIIILLAVLAGLGYAIYSRRRIRKSVVTDMAENLPILVEEKYRRSNVSLEDCRRLANELDILMQEKRLYVNPDLKITDLASILKVSPYTLSYMFNQYLKKNYYDYLNDYRIDEFKRLVNKDEYSKYTLTALAGFCGFSSRTSFFRYFKKVAGITPNDYIRSIGRNNKE